MTFTLTHPREEDPNFQVLMGLVGTLKGLMNWSAPIDHIAFDSDSRFAHITRNLGTGGHQQWKRSDTAAEIAAVVDSGFRTTALNTSGLATLNSLTVTPGATSLQAMSATTGSFSSTLGAGATSVTTLTASSTVQGTQLISTVSTGTAPLVVASTTKVTNLNADLLDGIDSTGFLTTTTGDARYLQLTGGTMTGQLTIQANQGLKLQNSGSGGIISLNATNVADPVLEIKDHSGDTTVTIGNSSSTYQLDVTGDGRVTDDLTVAGDGTFDRVAVGTTSFSGSEEFRVSGQSRMEGDLTGTTGTFDWQNSGNSRAKFDSTGIGFFGSTPIAKPTVVGSRGGNVALNNLLSELANLGLITNSTTA